MNKNINKIVKKVINDAIISESRFNEMNDDEQWWRRNEVETIARSNDSDKELRIAIATGELEIKYADGQPLEDKYYSYEFNGETKVKRIEVYKYNQYGTAIINSKRQELCNIINKDGILLSDQWFYISNLPYYIDSEGEQGLIKISVINQKGVNVNLMYVKDGTLMIDGWCKNIELPDQNGLMYIQNNEGYNFLKLDGTLLSNEWFNYATPFVEGISTVYQNNRTYYGFNFIDVNGNLLSADWFSWASTFENGFATVEIGGGSYKIDKNGNIYNSEGEIIRDCKKALNRRRNESIDRVVSEVLYEVRQKQMNEEGCGGATSCGGVGVDGNNTINVPMGKVQRRKIYSPKNEDLIRDSKELNEVKSMMSRLNKIK